MTLYYVLNLFPPFRMFLLKTAFRAHTKSTATLFRGVEMTHCWKIMVRVAAAAAAAALSALLTDDGFFTQKKSP